MSKWFNSISNGNFTAPAKKRLPSTPSPNSQFSLLQSPRGLIWLPFVRRLPAPTAPSNYSSPSCKLRLAARFADSPSASSTSTANSITSPQNECTLAGQSAVSRSERILDYNRQYLNDLPATSPHGSHSETSQKNLRILADQCETCGTAPAHQTRVVPHRSLASFLRGARVVPTLLEETKMKRDLCLVAPVVEPCPPAVAESFQRVDVVNCLAMGLQGFEVRQSARRAELP